MSPLLNERQKAALECICLCHGSKEAALAMDLQDHAARCRWSCLLVLSCEMTDDCSSPVAYIDETGFIYCEAHGQERQDYRRCRKLRPHELNRLKRGEQVEQY